MKLPLPVTTQCKYACQASSDATHLTGIDICHNFEYRKDQYSMTKSLQVNFLLLIRANGKAHVQGNVC